MTLDILALEKIHITQKNGLVDCKNTKDLLLSERLHIAEKAKKLNADFVFFSRTYNEEGRILDNSKPILYIYNREDNFVNSEEHINIHAKIWSAAEIDIYFIINKTKIHIFNARRPIEANTDGVLNVKNLCLVSEAVQQFNDQRFAAYLFSNGAFWEQESFFDTKNEVFYANKLNEKNAPYYRLLNHLEATKIKIKNDKNLKLQESILDKLLIICILVKFLEEIKDENGNYSLKKIYSNHRVKNFTDALKQGKCIDILDDLANEFNGKIFDSFSPNEQENNAIKETIKKANLNVFADFLNADVEISSSQGFLWKQYDFNHLPVELISSIYELFLQKKEEKEKGAVYTPPFLVNFLIDEAMPLAKAKEYFATESFKVLDPSCGSGVFLVAAYKRLLQWWTINNSTSQAINFPKKEQCQAILENNIFGVDVNDTATLITVFSLTIALLDKLEPKEIWTKLKFKNLRAQNIQTDNFFDWAVKAKEEKQQFDLVIGNPPFNVENRKNRKDVLKNFSKLETKHQQIPDNNLALHFFEAAMSLGAKVCMVLPSTALLYGTDNKKYRISLFTDFTINKIIDCTHLRESLFKGRARTPIACLLAISKKSQEQNIQHVIVKRFSLSENKIKFEIDHYDQHIVPYNWAIDESKQFIWKTNLLGGGQLFHFVYRLSLLPTLEDFINKKKEENGDWLYSCGYKIGNKKQEAPFLHNEQTISKFDSNTQKFITCLETNKKFAEPRIEALYSGAVLIICQKIVKNYIPSQVFKGKQIFDNSFTGIHVPKKDQDILEQMWSRLSKNKQISMLYCAHMFLTSSKLLIQSETAFLKEDLDNLPYPENEEYLQLSVSEKILQDDVLDYYIHLGKAISKGSAGAKLNEKVSYTQLEEYGQVFCEWLNPIYEEKDKKGKIIQNWQIGSVYQTENFTIYQFIYGKTRNSNFTTQITNEEGIKKADKALHQIIFNKEENHSVLYTRVARIYEHINGYDSVLLIKPNALRYWLKSIALRDANETFSDLKEGGF